LNLVGAGLKPARRQTDAFGLQRRRAGLKPAPTKTDVVIASAAWQSQMVRTRQAVFAIATPRRRRLAMTVRLKALKPKCTTRSGFLLFKNVLIESKRINQCLPRKYAIRNGSDAATISKTTICIITFSGVGLDEIFLKSRNRRTMTVPPISPVISGSIVYMKGIMKQLYDLIQMLPTFLKAGA
jgi:hypothetical protein